MELDDLDEEFYDCEAELEADEEEKLKAYSIKKPMGRLQKLGDLKLLRTGEPIYIPETQEVVPKTEDQLQSDEEILLNLGNDERASEMRARIMSAPLLSDMEAFKAANPGCTLSDFIRWYSPRDWIEEEDYDNFGQRKGHLSHRMLLPGNTWKEVWNVANPIPAKLQKRIFNENIEFEKIMDFLEGRTVKGIVELLLPVMVVCVFQKLQMVMGGEDIPRASPLFNRAVTRARMLNREPQINGCSYQELIPAIHEIELTVIRWKSVKSKFIKPKNFRRKLDDETWFFFEGMLEGHCMEVPGGLRSPMRSSIQDLFKSNLETDPYDTDEQDEDGSSSLIASEKEIILRVDTVKGPQRLYASIKKKNFTLAGAFSKNLYYSF